MTLRHKHHIIPKNEGGSDFAENLVEFTVTQHAMWHFAEWQRKGNGKIKLAWQGLSGLIGHEQLTQVSFREAGRKAGSHSKPQLQRIQFSTSLCQN